MSEQEDINELKAKLQQQAAQFQSYKEQCKNIEQMLEQESQKKQQQIRQLKQESIKREKGQKMLKAQVSQLQAQVQNLKGQLGDVSQNQSTSNNTKDEIDKTNQQNASLKQKNEELEARVLQFTAKLKSLNSELQQSRKKNEALEQSLTQAQGRASVLVSAPVSHSIVHDQKFQKQRIKLTQKLSSVQKQKSKLQKLLKQKETQHQKMKHQYEDKLKKAFTVKEQHSKQKQEKPSKRQMSESKQIKEHPRQTISLSEHKVQISKLRQIINNLEQKCEKFQSHDKQYSQKLQSLTNQKNSLLQKIKGQTRELQKERDRVSKLKSNQDSYQSPKKESHEEIVIMDNHQEQSSLTFDCLLLTKRHYMSPFIQIKDNKTIKLFKNTKNGFQKSLGATKHRFDSISYDIQSITQKTTTSIKQNSQFNYNHSIVIYGSKRTSKKYMMASIVQDLKEWIIERISQQIENEKEGNQVKCVYMKRSSDEEKNYLKEASNNKGQIVDILDEIIAMGEKGSPSKKQNKSKKSQKPKVRYFCLSLGQASNLEIITTSYLNPFLRNNQNFTDYINTIVFTKLPNILQSSMTNYHIITTLNPIVSLYEDCKNTLTINLVPNRENSSHFLENTSPMGGSNVMFSPSAINKDDLNDMTKKKLQSFEKQTELAGLKVRKVQDQCQYYKNRFEQLQIRLKNLINTHYQQNTYLKKSPVILSYEKLLKFVNSVLSRNTNASSRNLSPNFGHTSSNHEYQDQVNMYIEQDAKSLDGY